MEKDCLEKRMLKECEPVIVTVNSGGIVEYVGFIRKPSAIMKLFGYDFALTEARYINRKARATGHYRLADVISIEELTNR